MRKRRAAGAENAASPMCPSSSCERPTTRSIFLGNLGPEVALRDISGLGGSFGPLESVSLHGPKDPPARRMPFFRAHRPPPQAKFAFLNFVRAESASALVNKARLEGLSLGARRVTVTKAAKSRPIGDSLQRRITAGASRFLVVKGLPPRDGKEGGDGGHDRGSIPSALRPFLQKCGEVVDASPGKFGSVVVEMASVQAAVKARRMLNRIAGRGRGRDRESERTGGSPLCKSRTRDADGGVPGHFDIGWVSYLPEGRPLCPATRSVGDGQDAHSRAKESSTAQTRQESPSTAQTKRKLDAPINSKRRGDDDARDTTGSDAGLGTSTRSSAECIPSSGTSTASKRKRRRAGKALWLGTTEIQLLLAKPASEEESRTLVFFGLPEDIDEHDLCVTANRFGRIQKVQVACERDPTGADTGRTSNQSNLSGNRDKGHLAKKRALVRMVDSEAAIQMHKHARQGRLYINHHRIIRCCFLPPAMDEKRNSSLSRLLKSGVTRNLYVGNINSKFDEKALRNLFSPYGKFDSVIVIKGKRIAFVNMTSIEAAVTARSALNGIEVHGSRIVVNYAKEKIGQFAVGPSCSLKTSQPTKATGNGIKFSKTLTSIAEPNVTSALDIEQRVQCSAVP